MSELITQSELARHFGLAKSYISKLVKNGVLDGCRKDGKLVRECAIHAIERYRASGRSRRERTAELKVVASNPEVPEGLKDTPVATPENMRELDALMAEVDNPNRRVQLMKDFWAAKLNEYRAREQEGKLLPKEQVIEAGQKVMKAFRDKALALPSKIAPVLAAETDINAVRALLDDAVYELLEELADIENIA